jgi:dTDP-4-dehydrorhamnose reductase
MEEYDVIAPPRATFDLTAPEMLGYGPNNFASDFIINPAAYTALDGAEEESDLALKVNRDAPRVNADQLSMSDAVPPFSSGRGSTVA